MNVQSLLPFSPFLSLLYIAFALIQVLRKKRQGFGAGLLAFIALIVPLVALILTQNAADRLTLTGYLVWNTIIVFVGSIVLRLIERRNSARDAYRSYGMLGVGMGVLMAVEILAYPFVIAPLTGTSAFPNAAQNASTGSPAFVSAVTAQTGLSAEEVTTRLASGTKIADLVTQHNGDLNTVISAAAKSLDDMQAQGGRAVQFISNLGSNSTDIATQFVQGTLATQGQRILSAILLGGGTGGFGRNGQTASSNNGTGAQSVAQTGQNTSAGINAPAGFAPPPQNASDNSGTQVGQNSTGGGITPPAGFAPPAQNASPANIPPQSVTPTDQNASGGISAPAGFAPPVVGTPAGNNNAAPNGNVNSNGQSQNVGQVASAPTAEPTESPATPTENAIRPTVIAFPSATPTPDAPQPGSAVESTQSVSPAGVTCQVTPFYNLNLRDKPNTDGKIYLSIPYGTPVTANGHTADDWYSVTYNGQTGWVSGQYLSADANCKSIATVTADS